MSERTVVKELGKKAVVPSEEGLPPSLFAPQRASVTTTDGLYRTGSVVVTVA